MKITYLDLLNLVNEGTQPRNIKYGGNEYWWEACDYVCTAGNGHRLSEVMREWTTKAQTTTEIIEPVVRVLTEEEKQYLAAVIAPVRNRVINIHKGSTSHADYIVVNLKDMDMISLWNIGEDSELRFEGMDGNKDYTLEELGL